MIGTGIARPSGRLVPSLRCPPRIDLFRCSASGSKQLQSRQQNRWVDANARSEGEAAQKLPCCVWKVGMNTE